jgi:hypothetical protein
MANKGVGVARVPIAFICNRGGAGALAALKADGWSEAPSGDNLGKPGPLRSGGNGVAFGSSVSMAARSETLDLTVQRLRAHVLSHHG